MAKGTPGRESKLTPRVRDTICDAVRGGNFLVTAAALADVDESTVYNWLREAQEPGATPSQRDFFQSLTRARAEAEATAVAAVMADMKGGVVVEESEFDSDGGRTTRRFTPPNGLVALRYLQRAFPSRWADRKAIDPADESDDTTSGAATQATIRALSTRLHETLNEADEDDIADAEVLDPDEDP